MCLQGVISNKQLVAGILFLSDSSASALSLNIPLTLQLQMAPSLMCLEADAQASSFWQLPSSGENTPELKLL